MPWGDLLALAGALARGRPAGGLPALVGAVAEHAMRHRPADVEQIGEHGVATVSLQQASLVTRMGVALVAGHEVCAHDDSHGAGGERGPRRRRVGDPARGEQGQRHGPAHLRQQREQADDALHVPAGLDALNDQRVSARNCGRARRIPRGDLHQHPRASGARTRDQLGAEPERERHPRTLSSTATSSRSSYSRSSTRLTPNTPSAARAIERICSRNVAGSVHDAPSVPRPPACDTSLASRTAAPRPSGACINRTGQLSQLTE